LRFSGLIDEVRLTAGSRYGANFIPAQRLTLSANTRGLWKFDGQNANDSSANGLHGLLIGAATFSADVPAPVSTPSPTPTPGSDYSLALAAASSYVHVPDNPALDVTGPVTIEAWIKVESVTRPQGIVERFNSFGSSTSDGGYALRLTSAGKLRFYTIKNGAVTDNVIGGTTLTPNEWHHVAGVFDGGQLRVYLDGRLDGSKASGFVPVAGTASLKIGARGDDATTRFSGLIDEVRLTAGSLYGANFIPAQRLALSANTRGLWKFDGQNANDSSGSGMHGSLIGAATFSADVPVSP